LIREATGEVVPAADIQTDASTSARLRRHRLGIAGASMVGFVVIAALVGPLLLGIDPNLQNLTQRLLLPLSYSDNGVFH